MVKIFYILACTILFFNNLHAKGINCEKASTIIEHTICNDGTLILLDESLAKVYSEAMATTQDKNKLKKEQVKWLKEDRNTCKTIRCLKDAYRNRERELLQSSHSTKIDIKAANKLGLKGLEAYKKKDFDKAFKYSKMACDGNSVGGCQILGGCYMDGVGTQKDVTKALIAYDKACFGGAAFSCGILSSTYAQGVLVKQDLKKALTYSKFACEGNDNVGCYNLSVLYYNGLGVKRDVQRAKKLMQMSCQLGLKQACNKLKQLD